jgi:hypothetical protein
LRKNKQKEDLGKNNQARILFLQEQARKDCGRTSNERICGFSK